MRDDRRVTAPAVSAQIQVIGSAGDAGYADVDVGAWA
jgi:hypothetical protein